MNYNLETLKNVGKKSIISAITSLVLTHPSLGMEYEGRLVDPFAAFNKPLSFVPTDSDVEGEYEALCEEQGFSGSDSLQNDNEWLLQLEAELECELKNKQEKSKIELLENESVIENKQIIKYKGNYFIDNLSTFSDNVYYWLSYLFYGK